MNFTNQAKLCFFIIGTLSIIGFAHANTGTISTGSTATGTVVATGTVGTSTVYTGTITGSTSTGSTTGTTTTGTTNIGAVASGTITTTSTGSTGIASGIVSQATAITIVGAGIPEDPELVEALAWMYTNKITSFSTPDAYRPFDKITREEATKIFGRFAKNVLGKTAKPDIEDIFCVFIDKNDISPDLATDVFDACKMGLFRGGIDGFYPKVGLTKSQSIVALIRMFDNKTYAEDATPWFKNYYDRAFELGITKDKEMDNFNRFVTRYEIALMIYRFNLKYKLFKQFNGNILNPNQLMGMITESVVTSSNGLKRGTALFNTDILTNPNIESIPFQAFSGDKYTIKKRKVDNYGGGNSNFIRFGDIYASDEKTFLGTASFTVIHGFIEEAYIRPTELGKKYYTIKPSSQQPYYTIEEVLAE